MYPAAYPEVIAVASIGSNRSHSGFGNTGRYLDVSAPGEGIVSSWGTSTTAYAAASGTSMATPYAAAEAALVIAAVPKLSVARVTSIMKMTATHLGSSSVFGRGLIDPTAAVVRARAYRTTAHPTHAQLTRESNAYYFFLWIAALQAR